jgi:UDP-glucose 4-epimerase
LVFGGAGYTGSHTVKYLTKEGDIGIGVGTSVKEIIQAAEKVSEKICSVEYCARRSGYPDKLYASNDKAKSILNWNSEYTDIKRIIKIV